MGKNHGILTNDEKIIVDLKHTINTRTRYNQNSRSFYIDLSINFTGCSVRQVLQWAAKERVIKFQKQLRLMESEEKFNSFMDLGDQVEIFALEAGLSPELHSDKDEIIKTLKGEDI